MKLLIVDDEKNMRHMLTAMLKRHGYQIETAEDGVVALELIKRHQFDFVLCDVKMPSLDGLGFLREGGGWLNNSTVVMMSAYGTIDLALQAMKAGAYDFISKPFKVDEVLLTLKKAEERERLRKENKKLKRTLADIQSGCRFGAMVSASSVMNELFALVERVSRFDTTVLITGESGTGKELIARGIHEASSRGERPFIAVNCGSIPENLLESELFGYVKGAFTGAEQNKKGLFELADNATLFLDEIGDLPLGMQVKLLRVLQENEIRPVGSERTISINVRVLAATAANLEVMVSQGLFRADLYYRLNVMPVSVPPLRKRKEDIPILCHHFVKKFNSQLGTQLLGISSTALELLNRFDWPGNVRQLENAIQRSMIMARGAYIEAIDLPERIQALDNISSDISGYLSNSNLSLKLAQKKLEAALISEALARSGGNKSRAAEMLELSYPSLLSKIKLYGFEQGKNA